LARAAGSIRDYNPGSLRVGHSNRPTGCRSIFRMALTKSVVSRGRCHKLDRMTGSCNLSARGHGARAARGRIVQLSAARAARRDQPGGTWCRSLSAPPARTACRRRPAPAATSRPGAGRFGIGLCRRDARAPAALRSPPVAVLALRGRAPRAGLAGTAPLPGEDAYDEYEPGHARGAGRGRCVTHHLRRCTIIRPCFSCGCRQGRSSCWYGRFTIRMLTPSQALLLRLKSRGGTPACRCRHCAVWDR
jgi:hypothetical protein